jgi:ribonuclease Z
MTHPSSSDIHVKVHRPEI